MILLSIIVPVYNKAAYLDETLRSILRQTFRNFELIVVDDGSTDESAAICRDHSHDPRLRIISQRNRGVSIARNAGIKAASGSYVGFVDADDTIEPGMYALLMHNAITRKADISVCGVRTIIGGRTISPEEVAGPLLMNHDEAMHACLTGALDRSATNKIYKMDLIRDLRFAGHIYEDILYTCRAFLSAGSTVFEKTIKYNHKIRDDSVSSSGFNPYYLETTAVSSTIVNMMADEDERCQRAAMVFDITVHLSLLNLLLASPKGSYTQEYLQVERTLKRYERLISHAPEVRAKHKYAYRLFRFSPRLYARIMYAYCRLTGSDVIRRTK